MPARVVLSPAAMLTRCCTVSMSTYVDDGRATSRVAALLGTTSLSCTREPSSSSPSSIDTTVAPVRRASATRSSNPSGAASGATTKTVSSRRAASSRAMVTDRCGGASSGTDQRTSVGDSSGTPASRDSSSRCAARCHGSSVGVPTSNRLPGSVVERRSVDAKARVRSTHPLVASSSRRTCTRSESTGTCCPAAHADRSRTRERSHRVCPSSGLHRPGRQPRGQQPRLHRRRGFGLFRNSARTPSVKLWRANHRRWESCVTWCGSRGSRCCGLPLLS